MSHEKDPFDAHPDVFVPVDETGGVVYGHLHGTDGMSEDEVRHRIADMSDVDPADVTVRLPERRPAPKGRRSFGFSNWSGATWEPTGPQGNPSLN